MLTPEIRGELRCLLDQMQNDAARDLVRPHLDHIEDAETAFLAGVACATGNAEDRQIAHDLLERALQYDPFWASYHRGNLHLSEMAPIDALRCFSVSRSPAEMKLVRDCVLAAVRQAAASDDAVFLLALKIALQLPLVLGDEDEAGAAKEFRVMSDMRFVIDERNLCPPVRKSDMPQAQWTHDQANDQLYASVAAFDPISLDQPILLNCIPKAGTHLLRNVFLHFFGASGYSSFLQGDGIRHHFPLRKHGNKFFVGHIPFCADGLFGIRGTKQILLMRDPADLLVALTRAAYDQREQRPDYRFAQDFLAPEEYMTLLVRGYEIEGVRVEPFFNFFSQFLVDWPQEDALLVDQDDILTLVNRAESAEAEAFALMLLSFCGAAPPSDWRERVQAAANCALSATFLPPLPPSQKVRLLANAQDLLAGHAPGVVAWYARQKEKGPQERTKADVAAAALEPGKGS